MDSPSPHDDQSPTIEDKPLSTKRELEAEGRITPKRRCPPTPKPSRSRSRTSSSLRPGMTPRVSVFNGPRIVTTRSSDSGLSPLYKASLRESYFAQCFVKEATIGRGSFGEVYRVRSREDGRGYAVKCMLEPYRGERDRQQKISEAHKFESIAPHANLVRFVGAWEERQRLYIQMELCETSLDAVARSRHELDAAFLWSVFLDLLQALAHLHEHQLLHLDVKPENIFVTATEVFKLGDFGLLLDMRKEDVKNASDGDAKYLAPEMLNDESSPAADIFSLGITMFELATDAALPQSGAAYRELREGQIPERFLTRIPEELREFVVAMMHPEPSSRPTARQLLDHPDIARRVTWRQWQVYMKSFVHDKVSSMRSAFASLLDFVGRSEKKEPEWSTPENSPHSHPFAHHSLVQSTPEDSPVPSGKPGDSPPFSDRGDSAYNGVVTRLNFNDLTPPTGRRLGAARGTPVRGWDSGKRNFIRFNKAEGDESDFRTPPTSPSARSVGEKSERPRRMRDRVLMRLDFMHDDSSPATSTPTRPLDTDNASPVPDALGASPVRRNSRHRKPTVSRRAL